MEVFSSQRFEGAFSQALCAVVFEGLPCRRRRAGDPAEAEEAPAIQSKGAESSGQDDWNSELVRLHPPCRWLAIPSQAAPARIEPGPRLLPRGSAIHEKGVLTSDQAVRPMFPGAPKIRLRRCDAVPGGPAADCIPI